MAYAFLLPGLLLFYWLQRRSAAPAQAWSGWWSWLTPLLFFGMWVGIGIYLSRDFYDQVVLKEFLGRFEVGEAAPHRNQPVYFYLAHLTASCFPWSAVLIALFAIREVRARVRRDPALLWLACWAGAGLLFMSLVPSKRADRVYPVILPVCLLVAAAWPLIPRRLPSWAVPGLLLTALFWSGGYAGYRVWDGYRTHQGGLRQWGQAARNTAAGRSMAVASGRDEGMLLYLGLTHFTRADDVATAWKAGSLQFCVLPEREFKGRASDWEPCREVSSISRLPEKNSGYVLLERGR
jgi:4-amino-4-deoxy-L-arabinose transferase-like glycosyltransferase